MACVTVVDDDVDVREVLMSYLRAHRHQTVEAGDGGGGSSPPPTRRHGGPARAASTKC